jgi:hypothetical protein
VIVLLVQLDGKLPNVALQRASAHHKALGHTVVFKNAPNRGSLKQAAWFKDVLPQGEKPDLVYGSLIFDRTKPLAELLRATFEGTQVHLGGTGWKLETKLEDLGITTQEQDYSIYPDFNGSIGFSQRGCRLRCSFCVVPRKEGKVSDAAEIASLWRGAPYPKNLLLLDNDFFGQPRWREKIVAIREGHFKVCFVQGINSRLIDDEAAAAIASVDYRDDSFRNRRLYTAWDNLKDEGRLFAGLNALKRHGVKPDNVMVYVLIGFWPGETAEDREYRRLRLREWGARPYPMPFRRDEELAALHAKIDSFRKRLAEGGHDPWLEAGVRACEEKVREITVVVRELVGFQRWCIGAYDKGIPWAEWVEAKYQPSNLKRRTKCSTSSEFTHLS